MVFGTAAFLVYGQQKQAKNPYILYGFIHKSQYNENNLSKNNTVQTSEANHMSQAKPPVSYTLYDDGHHKCISFSGLVVGEGVQSNQFLIVDGDEAAIIDPGGDLTYTPLTIELIKHVDLEHLKYVIGSHQDPDIISSMPRWLIHTQAKVVISKLWERFLPHFNSAFTTSRLSSDFSERLITIPDKGLRIPLGKTEIHALPAHFLHSVGNFQFYDPVSKILFTGDMGASLVDDASLPVTDFHEHISHMKTFHQRYMASVVVSRLWADAVRQLDVSMLAPQHGMRFEGQQMIDSFLNWISDLECGVDLLSPADYQYVLS